MVRKSAQHPGVTGTELVRLLAGLIDPQLPLRDSRATFADSLSRWTGWTDAIALSAALERPMAAGPGVAEPGALAAEAARLRAQLAQAMVREVAAAGRSPLDAGLGYSPFRQCHVARQQSMGVAVDALRERARAALAQGTAAQARLAAVDAAMAQVLGAQERRLLATVPALLEKHFQRLSDEAQAGAEGAGAADDGASPWRDGFRHDLQAVLLAELDVRLQPALGLIEALGPDVVSQE